MKKIKAVIFDVDGLMFDTENLRIKACKYAMPIMGITISDQALKSAIGLPREGIMKVLFEDVGYEFDYETFRKIRLEYVQEYTEKYGFPVKDGLYEIISFIDSLGLKKAIATSNYTDIIHKYLSNANLTSSFETIVTMNHVSRGKPFPDLFLAASEKLSVPPKECLVLEDSPSGIMAAHAARYGSSYDTRCCITR